MFSEVLKVVPRIDRGQLNSMMSTLSQRFARVGERFGKGLAAIMKGNILFFSLGFLTQLLNPLEKVEDRIKKLLDRGSDIRDLADRFGTTPATILRLQQAAAAQGVKPEQLAEVMSKFADAVDKARGEIEDPTKEVSEASRAVAPFVNEEDKALGFFKFLRGLVARGQSAGEDVFFGDSVKRQAEERRKAGETLSPEERAALAEQGLVRFRSGDELRKSDEAAVFGSELTGGLKRFMEGDLAKELARAGIPIDRSPLAGIAVEKPTPSSLPGPLSPFIVRLPSTARGAAQAEQDAAARRAAGLGDTAQGPPRSPAAGVAGPRDPFEDMLNKLSGLEDLRRHLEVAGDTRDMKASTDMLTEGVVKGIEAAHERELERERMQQSNAGALLNAAAGIDQIKGIFEGLAMQVTQLIGTAGTHVPELIAEVKAGRAWLAEHFNFDLDTIKKNAEDILAVVVDPITDLVDTVEEGFTAIKEFFGKAGDSRLMRGIKGLFGGGGEGD